MYLKNISITNFRNYSQLSLTFPQGRTIIYGNNAQGKTNLLESIYFLGLTKSHRSYVDANLMKSGEAISRIEGTFFLNGMDTTLELAFDQQRKKLKVDANPIKRVGEYVSKVNLIIFYPEDLELIKGTPNTRRRYLNLELSQLNQQYLSVLNDFNKLLKMRNDYLKDLDCHFDQNYFTILTQYFIEKSIIIYRMRHKFIEKINQQIGSIFEKISKMKSFQLAYIPSVSFLDYDAISMETILREEFSSHSNQEFRLKTTLVGPQRDDFDFQLNGMSLKEYGSQGQQRMAVLALKLSEIEIFKQATGEYPILLLDDVFSELDEFKRNNLLDSLPKEIQTIITTTDLANLNQEILMSSKLVEIKQGTIVAMEEVQEDGRKN